MPTLPGRAWSLKVPLEVLFGYEGTKAKIIGHSVELSLSCAEPVSIVSEDLTRHTLLSGKSAYSLDNAVGPYVTRQVKEDASCSQTGGDSDVYLDGAVVFIDVIRARVVQTHSFKGVKIFCPRWW